MPEGLSSGHCHHRGVQRQTTSLSPEMHPPQHFPTPGPALVDLGHGHRLRKSNLPLLRVNELNLREVEWLVYCYHQQKWLIWDLSPDLEPCPVVYWQQSTSNNSISLTKLIFSSYKDNPKGFSSIIKVSKENISTTIWKYKNMYFLFISPWYIGERNK